MNSDKLTVTTPSDTEILMTRYFDAPKDVVFRFFTDYSTHPKWVGCGMAKSLESTGGNSIGDPWKWVMDMGDGNICEFFGQCLEHIEGEKSARTFMFNMPSIREMVTVEVATFTSEGDRTKIEILVRHLDQASRDGQIASGMEHGASMTYDNLETLIKENS
ncbi:MAG: SRPBCC domain-containing protein [Armatimonadetes bacterium]|nr:SRPBCC domain-containing protein [Armatimonadota bacterium]